MGAQGPRQKPRGGKRRPQGRVVTSARLPLQQNATSPRPSQLSPAALALNLDTTSNPLRARRSGVSPMIHSTEIDEHITEHLMEQATAPEAPAHSPPALTDGEDAHGSTRESFARGRGMMRRVSAGIRGITAEQWLWIALLVVAAVLRYWNLGQKPLHHDESMHAYYSLMYARDPSSSFVDEYQPILHGPFQFHAVGAVFAAILALQHLFGVGGPAGNPWINDATARIVPAAFGVGIVALPYGLRRELGRVGAWIAALLLAVSPAFVYFSRFLREDIYFNFFMFAMVVCAVHYARKRTMRWLVGLFVAAVLAYATFEGTFLTLVIFGSFLIALAVWELAESLAQGLPANMTPRERLFFSRAGLLLALGAVGSVVALIALHVMRSLNSFITQHPQQSDLQVARLENVTEVVLVALCFIAVLLVMLALLWQSARESVDAARTISPAQGTYAPDGEPRPRTAFEQADRIVSAPGRAIDWVYARLDSRRQAFLRLLLAAGWEQWFVACVTGLLVFVALFFVIPGPGKPISIGQGFQEGIGRGVWQGLYYWLQQQQVARGGQPWYYYLLLIPLYEQLAVVFSLVGVVYTLLRPTRFRVFLVWWFLASLGIYSWAGEKMPWLSIHILLPMMLLAGLVLGRGVRQALTLRSVVRTFGGAVLRTRPWQVLGVGLGGLTAILLFIPMLHSMFVLNYVEPANPPLEMMEYVQTTPDVQTVMQKINLADQRMYAGQHKLRIAVGQGEEWPFYWYLRDYYLDPHPSQYVSFGYQPTSGAPQEDVLILYPGQDVQTFLALHPTGYRMREYKLRSWWDEAYKPAPCVATKGHPCPPPGPLEYGVGLGNYLSYGSTPPPHASFNPARAASRLWNWLWLRQPLGSTNGSYDFVFIVRDGVPIQP